MFLSLEQIGFLQLIESCQEALVYLQSKVDQAEIRIACSEDLDVVVRSQQVEQLSANQGKQVIIKVYCNGSEGVVSTTQSDFLSIKKSAQYVGEVKTFSNFIVEIPSQVSVNDYNTIVIWCEAFNEFITAAKYR